MKLALSNFSAQTEPDHARWTKEQEKVLKAVALFNSACFLIMMGIILSNSYLFIYKMREYRRFHSCIFYLLSFGLVVCRLVDFIELYRLYGIYSRPDF